MSEVGKRTINGAAANENLNFVRLPGRKSVKKDERTPSKGNNSHILPSRLRGNYDSQKESRKKSMKRKKEGNHSMGDHFQKHPMIINQIQDSVNHSRLSESKWMDMLTPKSGRREGKTLKTAKSHHSKVISETRGTSDNEWLSTKVDKNTNYLQCKIAYDFNLDDYFSNSDNTAKRTPEYQVKYELQKQRAYIHKLTNGSLLNKNLAAEFNAVGRWHSVMDL